MRQIFAALSLTTVLCFSTHLSAQTFTDPAEWAMEICGTIISDDFNNLTGQNRAGENIFTFPVQSRPFGTFGSENGRFPNQLGLIDEGVFVGISLGEPNVDFFDLVVLDTEPLTFTPDLAGDALEGFCFEYKGSPIITIFNGTEEVDTIIAPTSLNFASICYINTDLEDVTRIEVSIAVPEPGAPFERNEIASADFAFKAVSAPPVETCKSMLQDLIIDLGTIESTGNSTDDQLINYALWYLECATHDSLWNGDDRVASGSFFFYMKKGTKFLSWVSGNAEVDQLLEDIQAVLTCVVENEIAAATADDGNANELAWAAYYQDCADYFQSIGDYRKAAKFRKWAWLFATSS